jgi:uncharacterized protein (TIGR02594 family)
MLTSGQLAPAQPWGPPWLLWGLGELGVLEADGDKDNPRIVWYHSFTSAGKAPDGVPWCSSYVNAGMQECGYPGTRSKAASSWLAYGVPYKLCLGGILVFGKSDPDAKGTGHVGWCAGWSNEWVLCLGGNQAQRVSVVRRPIRTVLDVRMPERYLAEFGDPGGKIRPGTPPAK